MFVYMGYILMSLLHFAVKKYARRSWNGWMLEDIPKFEVRNASPRF